MEILLIRHAIAMERIDWAEKSSDDSKRPLTELGREKMIKGAHGISTLKDINYILTSPFTRAYQTAEILAEKFPEAEFEACEYLVPGGDFDVLLEILKNLPEESTVALIGHEPEFSELLMMFLPGDDDSITWLKKGSLVSICFDDEVDWGDGRLDAIVPPKVLRSLH